MNKFFIVLQREYLTRVKKKSFVVFTLLTPLLFVALIAVPVYMGMQKTDTSEKVVVLIDKTQKYEHLLVSDNTFTFVKGDKEIEQYRQEPFDGAYAYVLISDDLLNDPHALQIHSPKQIPSDLQDHIKETLLPVLRDERIKSFDIPDLQKIIDEAKVSLFPTTIKWDKDGNETTSSSSMAGLIGQLFNVLIYIFILMYGMMVMQSVREEKKSRIVEIIISSVPATTLLFAKICAIALLGFTQIFLWIAVIMGAFIGVQLASIGTVLFSITDINASIAAAGMNESFIASLMGFLSVLSGFNISGILVAFVFYFIMGYFVYASIFAAVGAAVDNDEDVNQMLTPITMLLVFAFYIGISSGQNPDGPMALWGSFIPLTSPIVMMTRMPYDPPMWQISISALSLVISTVLLVWVAAKIFRVGILMYGKKPSFKEMWQWLRYK